MSNNLEDFADQYGYASYSSMRSHMNTVIDRMVHNYRCGFNPANQVKQLHPDLQDMAWEFFHDRTNTVTEQRASGGARLVAGVAGVAAGVFASRLFR
jgi:hypothetical protein